MAINVREAIRPHFARLNYLFVTVSSALCPPPTISFASILTSTSLTLSLCTEFDTDIAHAIHTFNMHPMLFISNALTHTSSCSSSLSFQHQAAASSQSTICGYVDHSGFTDMMESAGIVDPKSKHCKPADLGEATSHTLLYQRPTHTNTFTIICAHEHQAASHKSHLIPPLTPHVLRTRHRLTTSHHDPQIPCSRPPTST